MSISEAGEAPGNGRQLPCWMLHHGVSVQLGGLACWNSWYLTKTKELFTKQTFA